VVEERREVSEPRLVRVAPELVQVLAAKWSEPVQVRIDEEAEGGELVLVFRTYICESEHLNPYDNAYVPDPQDPNQ
jgi:hypothetical protein